MATYSCLFKDKKFIKTRNIFSRLESQFAKNEISRDEKLVVSRERKVEFDGLVVELKSSLFDFYARIFWEDPELCRQIFLNRQGDYRGLNIYSEEDYIKVGHNASLEVLTKYFDPEFEEGILRFLPLLKKGGGKLHRGLIRENHGSHGYHFHFCEGEDKKNHIRTSLLFTNVLKDKQEFYHEQHSGDKVVVYDDLGSKIKKAIWTENQKQIAKVTTWKCPGGAATVIIDPHVAG